MTDAFRQPRAPVMTKAAEGDDARSPGELIDEKIASLGDWRGEILAHCRKLIHRADPGITEAVKWRKPTNPAGVPVWEHAGLVCTGETYKAYVKLTFASGALLPDPAGLFNGSLNGNARRAIDIHQGDEINDGAFIALVEAAVAFNVSKKQRG